MQEQSVYSTIKTYLERKGIVFRTVHHEPTHTSEESAQARDEEIAIGGKAIVMKVDDVFRLFVISAANRIDSQQIKKHFGAKKLRFASAEELLQLTGLVPGSVPPFGKPILPFELYVDTSILHNTKIAFNAGSLTDSIIMQQEDYIRVADAEVFSFSA